jgi:hypothetical protein
LFSSCELGEARLTAGFFVKQSKKRDGSFQQSRHVARSTARGVNDQTNLEEQLKQEQEKQRQALADKTERLRELRLAKEAAEKESKDSKPVRRQTRRPRRSKHC